MTVIKATCPECGDVDLSPSDLVIEVEETLSGPVRMFAFDHAACATHVRGYPSEESAIALEKAGVRVLHFRLPAEAREPHEGPTITEDDVIGFGRWLEQVEDPIRHLVAA